MPDRTPIRLVLASTSRYRRELLARLGLPFETAAPEVAEGALPGETPRATALRLAAEKARAVAPRHPQALIIGSDQVAELDGQAINKPLNHENALAQLRAMRGKRVDFHSALALFNARTGALQADVVTTHCRFRSLPDDALERYLRREQPYDCAGSAKAEALGIALLAAIEADDPTALIGLPLIRLTDMLLAEGVSPLDGEPA